MDNQENVVKICGKVLFDLCALFLDEIQSGLNSRVLLQFSLDFIWMMNLLFLGYFFSHRYFQKLKRKTWAAKEIVNIIPVSLLCKDKELAELINEGIYQL